LNLVDRLSFVKLPQAAVIQTVEEEEDESPDPSLLSEFQAAGETVQIHVPSKEERNRPKNFGPRGQDREIFDLDDFAALASLEDLICRYGRVSHMGILDRSYTFFLTKNRKAALYYKIKNKVAVVGGDPICPPHLFPLVLSEFEKYRKKRGVGLAFLRAGQTFVNYARTQKYTMCFAFERVLNPMTNPVLHSSAGKSITRIARNLLDPKKGNLTLEVYTPGLGKNAVLQQQLVNVYEAWRSARNDSDRPQAYITVYDPFALPELMTYIYTRD
jgi:phosphatidylglycerol lysyltransferase-like protein